MGFNAAFRLSNSRTALQSSRLLAQLLGDLARMPARIDFKAAQTHPKGSPHGTYYGT
jgi:hypothetical protein